MREPQDALECPNRRHDAPEAQRLRSEAQRATERFDRLWDNVSRFQEATGISLGSYHGRTSARDEYIAQQTAAFQRLQMILNGDMNTLVQNVGRTIAHHSRIREALASVERLLNPPQVTTAPANSEPDPLTQEPIPNSDTA